MIYNFTETQKNKVIEHWNQDFYSKILRDIETYSAKWKLSGFKFVEYYSINAIFFCKSEAYGDCVLKICNNQDYEFIAECNMLREYNGGRFIKIYECDASNKIMLIERIIPGKMLRDEMSLEKRLSVFSGLFNGLHIVPENPEIYTPYIEQICDVEERMREHSDFNEFYVHVVRAKNLCLEIEAVYDKKVLLHGDLHYDNILSGKNGKYKIIDPQGYTGAFVFDVGRYILNEEYGAGVLEKRLETVIKVADYFEKSLNIPKRIINQCFYIDVVLVNSESAVSGVNADLDDIKFAESVMNT